MKAPSPTAVDHFDRGDFQRTLARRIACATESQDPAQADALHAYLTDELAPALAALGAHGTLHDNPVPGAPPLLIGSPSKKTPRYPPC